MTDLKALLEIVEALQTPILAFIAWLVFRLYTNHIPHLQRGIDETRDAVKALEGAQDERRARRRR